LDEAADGTLHLLAAALPNDGFNTAAGAERMPGEEKVPCELRHAVAEVASGAAPAARHSALRLWRWAGGGGGGGASCDVLSGVHCFAQGLVVLEGFDAATGQRAVWTSRNGSARRRVRAGGRGVWLDDGSVAWAANREDAPPDAGLALAASSLAAPTNPFAFRLSGHEASHGPDTAPSKPPPNAANAPSAAWWSYLEAETLLVPTSDGENVPVSLVCLKRRTDTAGAHGDMDLWGSVVLYGYGAVMLHSTHIGS
jgi:hypothetical protein